MSEIQSSHLLPLFCWDFNRITLFTYITYNMFNLVHLKDRLGPTVSDTFLEYAYAKNRLYSFFLISLCIDFLWAKCFINNLILFNIIPSFRQIMPPKH